jgi:hypothetical protein
MNRTIAVIGLLAALILVSGPLAAQEEPAAAEGEVIVPVKPYKALEPPAVYRAARSGITADVRFADSFSRRVGVPNGFTQVELNGFTYGIVAAFRTQGDILCLIPATSTDALAAVFGAPTGVPLSPAILDQRMVLNEGQKLVVEGTIFGEISASKAVVADAVIIGHDPRPRAFHALQILWPGAQAPEFITGVGEHELSVPSSVVPDETVSAAIEVLELSTEQLLAELAERAAQREGVPDAQKVYGEYDAGQVYRHAADNNAITVDFTDRINTVIGFRGPARIASVPAARGGVIVDLPIGYAFSTQAGLTCVVPSDQPVLVARAASALPGELVRIRGNVIGRTGAFALVLADYVGFPDQEALTGNETAWVAVLSWPDTYPRVFWHRGNYVLVDLPSPAMPGRFERLQITLGEFRRIEVAGAAPGGVGQ